MKPLFTTNAGLTQNSVACALNIMRPVTSTTPSPPPTRQQVTRHARYGERTRQPEHAQVEIATAPTSSTMPVM